MKIAVHIQTKMRRVHWFSADCIIIATVFWSFLALASAQTDEDGPLCDFKTDLGSSSGSASGIESSTGPLPECLPLTDDILRERVLGECQPFLRNRCFMHDYLDYERARSELSLLNAALLGSSERHIRLECRDVIRAFVCNYYYVGCNRRTRLAQGICAESCAEYVENGDCAPSFAWLVGFAVATGSSFVFTPDCDNPLWYVKVHDPSLENVTLDTEGCINMSEVVENPIIPVATRRQAESDPTESGRSDDNIGTVVGASFAVSAVIIIIVGALLLTLGLYVRRVTKQKKKIRRNLIESMSADRRSSLNNYGISDRFIRPRGSVVSSEYDPVGEFKLTPEDINLLSQELKNALIPFHQVKITGDLGEGAFGCVYKGILTKETEEGVEEIGVAIKTIKNHSAYHELKNFLEESSIMCSFSHPNVLGMEGVCLDKESQSPYLILPFMKKGDLKTYLRKKRSISMVDLDYPDGLSHNMLLGMCYQIACGMEYLASRKLVHRDLAARNCMIDRDNTVKVADFGLTRDIYQKDYYRQSSRGQVPVKWMAPESLVDHISNEKTDVWSFGVTCWEVFSLGRVPYPTITNSEVVDYLINGRRLQKPALCSDRFYDIMLLCWKDDPENRPTFEGIMEMLQTIVLDSCVESGGQFGSLAQVKDSSYVEMSDFSSSDNATSDESTVFANNSRSFGYDSISRYSDVPHSRNRSYHEHFDSSRHTPQIPSPLLRSVSYEIPHSIPRESFLQNNLSASSAASIYLEMAPGTPIRLTTLLGCDSPES